MVGWRRSFSGVWQVGASVANSSEIRLSRSIQGSDGGGMISDISLVFIAIGDRFCTSWVQESLVGLP